jgi:hypothetical protein
MNERTITGRDKIHPFCSMCGADLTQEGSLTIDLPDSEWGEFTGRVGEYHDFFPEYFVVYETHLDFPITCSECGAVPEESVG